MISEQDGNEEKVSFPSKNFDSHKFYGVGLPINDDRITWSLIPVSTALLLTASTAHHFVSQQHSAHLRILVLAFVRNRLKYQLLLFLFVCKVLILK